MNLDDLARALREAQATYFVRVGDLLRQPAAALEEAAFRDWLAEQDLTLGQAVACLRFATDPDGRSLLAAYGVEKALWLLAVPPANRPAFLAQHDVASLDTRALERAIAQYRRAVATRHCA